MLVKINEILYVNSSAITCIFVERYYVGDETPYRWCIIIEYSSGTSTYRESLSWHDTVEEAKIMLCQVAEKLASN